MQEPRETFVERVDNMMDQLSYYEEQLKDKDRQIEELREVIKILAKQMK